MEMDEKDYAAFDNTLLEETNIKYIKRPVCKTDQGSLYLVLKQGENEYHFYFDDIPMEKEKESRLRAKGAITKILQGFYGV